MGGGVGIGQGSFVRVCTFAHEEGWEEFFCWVLCIISF